MSGRTPEPDVDPADDEDPNERRCFASPPCFMHELDPAYLGLDVETPAAAKTKRKNRPDK